MSSFDAMIGLSKHALNEGSKYIYGKLCTEGGYFDFSENGGTRMEIKASPEFLFQSSEGTSNSVNFSLQFPLIELKYAGGDSTGTLNVRCHADVNSAGQIDLNADSADADFSNVPNDILNDFVLPNAIHAANQILHRYSIPSPKSVQGITFKSPKLNSTDSELNILYVMSSSEGEPIYPSGVPEKPIMVVVSHDLVLAILKSKLSSLSYSKSFSESLGDNPSLSGSVSSSNNFDHLELSFSGSNVEVSFDLTAVEFNNKLSYKWTTHDPATCTKHTTITYYTFSGRPPKKHKHTKAGPDVSYPCTKDTDHSESTDLDYKITAKISAQIEPVITADGTINVNVKITQIEPDVPHPTLPSWPGIVENDICGQLQQIASDTLSAWANDFLQLLNPVYKNSIPSIKLGGGVEITPLNVKLDSWGSDYMVVSGNSSIGGNAARFASGSQSYMETIKPDDLSLNHFSLEAWIRTDNAGSNFERIIFKPAHEGGQNYSLALYNGKPHVRFDTKEGAKFAEGPSAISDNNWHHIAGVNDGNEITIYLDGNLVGSSSVAGAVPITSVSNLVLGRADSHDGQYLNAIVSDVRVWNTARSGEEISGFMDSALSGDEHGLVAYYRFDEVNGNKITDNSGFGHEGTLEGGAEIVHDF